MVLAAAREEFPRRGRRLCASVMFMYINQMGAVRFLLSLNGKGIMTLKVLVSIGLSFAIVSFESLGLRVFVANYS